MLKLQPIAGSELSKYVIELLSQHNIVTVQDFLTADVEEISKLSNLSAGCSHQLQAKLRELHCPQRLNYLTYTKSVNAKLKNYKFGIESLDELLESHHATFGNSSIFEIFGLSGTGKTRFCHSVALNIVRQCKVEALYIDTKLDFSGSCLYQMMRARDMETSECGAIMQSIKVERAMTLQAVHDVLEQLEELLKTNASDVANIKLIIIDSLPAVWFTLNSDEESLERNFFLCKIANLLRKLAKNYYTAVLLVNLALQDEEVLVKNADMPNYNLNAAQIRQSPIDIFFENVPLRPALGRYWAAIPNVRLCLKMPDEVATTRSIEITRNSFGPSGGICHVKISDAGVVSF